MSTHNIHIHEKIEKKILISPYIFIFCSYRKNFTGTQKHVRISHGKRVIVVRVIEVVLYYCSINFPLGLFVLFSK